VSRHDHRCIVIASLMIPKEDCGDHRGMARGKARVSIEIPMRRQAVGMKHEERTRDERERELLHFAHVRAQDSVVRDEAARAIVGRALAEMLPMPQKMPTPLGISSTTTAAAAPRVGLSAA